MKFKIPFWIVFSLIPFWAGHSQSLDQTIELGDRYFESGQIPAALYTYQRAIFYSKSGADGELLLKIANCFQIEGDFENSLEYFDHAYFSEPSDSLKLEILFKKANSFIQTGNYHFALIELLGIQVEPGSVSDKRKSLYLASAYYGLEDYKNAEVFFIKCLPPNEIAAAEDLQKIFKRNSNFYRPNPKTAMWLSVFVPGLGQFYSGDWSAGINSFLLTGSLVGLTFYLTSVFHPIDAVLTALPWFQRYYQGGFGQAEKIAENRRGRKRDLAFQQIIEIIRMAKVDY